MVRTRHPEMMDEKELRVKYLVTVRRFSGGQEDSFKLSLGYRPNNSTKVGKDWNNDKTCFVNYGPKVKVYVCSIFYLGPVDTLEHESNDEIMTYWCEEARTQLGTHVFVSRYGTIAMISTFVEKNSDDIYVYSSTKNASISSIYPVYRIEPIGALSCYLTLGLFYRDFIDSFDQNGERNRFNKNYYEGDRHYCRFGDSQTGHSKCGHVFEIKETEFTKGTYNIAAKNSFAFYVCAGAKLVVLDEYHDKIYNKHHNRSLVQQGGLVMVEGCEFLLSVKLETYPLALAKTNGVLVGTGDFDQIPNPVIFLGPNDSEYQSIAWNLSIVRNQNENDSKKCILTIPEGGRIAAIEDWNAGMEEVRARQLYERLHEATVEMMAPGMARVARFVMPTKEMLEKILGIPDRHIDCYRHGEERFKDIYTPAQPELPKQFNTYKCVDYSDLIANGKRAWVPPMNPPIYFPGRSSLKLQYPPSKYTVSAELNRIRDNNQKVVNSYLIDKLGWTYKCDTTETIEDIQMVRMPDNTTIQDINGINFRMGIDGWFYRQESIPSVPTLKFEIPVYGRIAKEDNP